MAAPRSLQGVAAQSAESIFVWQVAAQIVGALMTPLVQEITRTVNSVSQTTPLSPQELADMVNRAIVSLGDGEAYAKQSGISPSDFLRLVQAAGDAISPQEAVTALRRGLIPRTGRGPDSLSLEQAIAESRIREKWVPVIEKLGAQPLPVADAVDAVVESQISHDEGAAWAARSGIDGDVFTILFNTRGNPPSPVELQDLVRRRVIPMKGLGPDATSLEQGIAEGATKNKWTFAFEELVTTIPPPRTVTALLRNGSITDTQAATWFEMAGLAAEAADAYVADAHHQKQQGSKELAKADILKLYSDRIISGPDATAMLEQLRYTADEAGFELAITDFRREAAAVQRAIDRVHNLYVTRKIEKARAVGALDALRVPSAQRDQLLQTWDIERTTTVKVLTEAQIADAFFRGIISQGEAMDELVAQGYTPLDAWILLSVRKHEVLPGRPAPGPAA